MIDLFLGDIGGQDWAGDLFAWAKGIVKFIKAHHKSLAIFRSKSQFELKQAGATSDCLQTCLPPLYSAHQALPWCS